jgi:hypothetical protein
MTSAAPEVPSARVTAPSVRWSALIAGVLGCVNLVVVVASYWLGTMAHQLQGGGVQLLVAVPFVVVGLLITLRRPGNRMGWLLLLGGVFIELNFGASYYTELVYRLGSHLPLGAVALVVQPSWAPAIVCFGLLVMLFPDGELPYPWFRWLLWPYLGFGAVWVAGAVAITINEIVSGRVRVDGTGNLVVLDNPGGGTVWWGVVEIVFFVLLVVVMIASVIGQAVRFRRSTGERRQQLKWLLYGTVAMAPGLVVAVAFGSDTGFLGDVSGLGFVLVAALPVSIGVAVLRYRLYDIDRLISRTLAYGLVTALLVGGYIGLVLLATRVLPFSSTVGVAVSTLAAAAVFNPLRRRVQHLVDRRFNRARYDADLTVAAFAARLQDAVDLAAVRADLASTAQAALEPEHLSVWIWSGGS